MNYHHGFHAGNFADVFKHMVLVALIESLKRKNTPFCFLDTHAGVGRYDLYAEEALKTREFESGIKKVYSMQHGSKSKQIDSSITDIYLKIITEFNPTALRYYPGSPRIVRALMRPQDRMVLTELNPQAALLLKQEFFQDSQVAVHHQDGYQGLKAFLPPKERRGLVLIDPPFESSDELAHILSSMKTAIKRWETGIYAIWYPLKDRRITDAFLNKLKYEVAENLLVSEFMLYPDDVITRLNGCGMAIINPPWQMDKDIALITYWLRGSGLKL